MDLAERLRGDALALQASLVDPPLDGDMRAR